jgi:hypothetical protein
MGSERRKRIAKLLEVFADDWETKRSEGCGECYENWE